MIILGLTADRDRLALLRPGPRHRLGLVRATGGTGGICKRRPVRSSPAIERARRRRTMNSGQVILLTGMLVASACALPGSFLLLRRMAMMATPSATRSCRASCRLLPGATARTCGRLRWCGAGGDRDGGAGRGAADAPARVAGRPRSASSSRRCSRSARCWSRATSPTCTSTPTRSSTARSSSRPSTR